ncbi:MAG: MerR family transcriptional regulator [Anaerolineales bacterium]|nr:MerR family transcriptional regulator [Anaerolineales bacterium]
MSSTHEAPTFNLKAVLAQTGVKAHTLRAWEKKYGLPRPARSKGNQRLYTQQDIDIILWLLARIDEGFTIRRAAELWLSLENRGQDPLLFQAVPEVVPLPALGPTDNLTNLRNGWIGACLQFDHEATDKYLSQAFALFPIKTVCHDILLQGIHEIGELWFINQVSVPQEHFASAKCIEKFNTLLNTAPVPTRPIRLLLACPPREEHTISLLLLALLLRYQGLQVVYLGAKTPVTEIETAAREVKPDLVILAAQRLETAANLAEATEALAQIGIPTAYGGSIFNRVPGLSRYVTGHFLGQSIEDAVPIINKLLIEKPPMYRARPLPLAYQHNIHHFISSHSLISYEMMQAMNGSGIPQQFLEGTSHRFKESILAALKLGDIHLLDSELTLTQHLMENHGITFAMQRTFLHTYHQACQTVLEENSDIVTTWLANLAAANYTWST